mgnify:FL=1
MGAKAGRLLRGVSYHSVCQHYLVSQNLSEREVLHFSSCHRVSEPPLRGYISDTDLLPGAGELPFTIHGRLARRGCGAAHGADSVGENSAFKDDFTAALLGDVGQRVYAGHQQSRRAENPMRGQQSRPPEHLRGGTRIVQLPHRETHQQEGDAEVVGHH